MKIVDLKLYVDGLICESVEDYIKQVEEITNSTYDIVWEIMHEEDLENDKK